MNARTKAAFGYRRDHGLNPFPVGPDKRPAFHLLELARGTPEWGSFRDDPATEAEIGYFWEHDPKAGLAIIVKPGHVVVDVDHVDADDVPDVPRTWTAETPRGLHFHLHSDAPVRHRKFGWGELLVAGDICVMPPTPGYQVAVDVAEFAELPESLVQIARERQVAKGALVSGVLVTGENRGQPDAQEDVSLRLLAALGGPENAVLGRNFRCVLHDDRHASAELYRLRDGTVAYHCWGSCGWLPLPVVHARQSGRHGRIGRVELALWRLSLLERAGLVEGVALEVPEVPLHLRNVWRGFIRLLALRWRTTPGSPAPFARSFAAPWCGVTEHELRVAFEELRRLGFVRYAGRDPRGRLSLWLAEGVMPMSV